MEVVFERTGQRSYAVEVRRSDAPVLRMESAPGFDRWCDSDEQHAIRTLIEATLLRHQARKLAG
jgi:hypothetical protein